MPDLVPGIHAFLRRVGLSNTRPSQPSPQAGEGEESYPSLPSSTAFSDILLHPPTRSRKPT
jgi:hypothetical protein